jgi:TPR repeat protein
MLVAMRRIVTSILFLFLLAPAGAAAEEPFHPLARSPEHARQFDAGVAAYDSGDYARAYALWEPLARRDDLAAMRNVAHLLRRGLGVEQDERAAFRLYRRAAEAGLISAQVNLGDMYRRGEGTERDPRMAIAWFHSAASAGHPLAMYFLGEMSEIGEGMTENRDRAVSLYRMAAARDLPQAIARLEALGLAAGPPEDSQSPPAPGQTAR